MESGEWSLKITSRQNLSSETAAHEEIRTQQENLANSINILFFTRAVHILNGI